MAITDPDVTPGELQPINEVAEWVEHLPAIETGVIIRAGDDGEGAMNFQARVLDSRTRFLKQLIEALASQGVILKGHLDTQEQLDAIDTTNLQVGTAYFLNFALRIWNGTEWGDSGSLRGERGINLLGTWPEAIPLPEVTENEVGDAYIWRSDIHVLVPTTGSNPPVWEGLGIRGPDGKDTYTIWKEQPGNENKTVTEFLAAQKGEKGDDAYVTWKKIPGNENKTIEQWAASTKGETGDEGPPKAAYTVAGAKANTAALPRPGVAEDAWYVGIDLYVWIEADTDYIMIPGIAGKSAYQDWEQQEGNEGKTLAEFLESLKGEKGADSIVPGPKGDDGRNLRVLGTVANAGQLGNVVNPQDQDGYVTLDTGRLWMYLLLEENPGWKDLGPFRGQDGLSAYEVWVQQPGNEGKSETAFFTELKGTDGKSIIIRGAVDTFADLPADPEDQWVYAVRDVRSFYAYVVDAWVSLGTFGRDGVDGVDGKSLDIIKILTEEDQTIPTANNTNLGKAYLDLDKFVWVNIQSSWQNAGKFVGQTGEIGPPGKNFRPKGMVNNVNALPLPQNSTEGDAYVAADTKMMYALVDGQWEGPIDLIGPIGKDGPQGIPGALMPILGAYKTMALLIAAHPTGSLGDAYMIIDATAVPPVRDLAIWSVEDNAWLNTGPAGIVGPEGQPGPPGKDSTVPGPKGSQWLTLTGFDAPSNTFNGRAGDWAVNEGLKVFYKTVNEGWIIWGQLVAGDVNSPLLSEGKVVRLGNAWVPLPVDEVPDDGEAYMRTRAVGEDEGAWLKFTPPTLAGLGGIATTELGVSVAQLVGGFVPSSQLPSYVDDVLDFANRAAFPATGEKGKIYIAEDTNTQWRWTGSTYISWASSPGSTDSVAEGSVNLYFTQARVRSTPLTGLSLATASAVAAADTVITAFGKLQAQINNFVPGFADVPLDSNLYLRKGDRTWSIYVAPTPGMPLPANITDNKTYVVKNGAWVEFNRYDLPVRTVSATATIDALTDQFVVITNTGSTAKTITLSDGPKAPNPVRAMVIVVKINGATGVITFAPTGATALVWNGGTPPALTGSRTYITFTWDGVEWTGAPGAVVP